MYANKNQKSEVTYAGYFLSENGKNNLKEELKADISALFILRKITSQFAVNFRHAVSGLYSN